MVPLLESSVLITGGTGSFGRCCAELLLRLGVRRLVLFSRDEQKHVFLRREVFPPDRFPAIRYFVGDVRDADRLRLAMRGIDCVIHAAAMKHVDVAEYNPQECIRTNIGGAENVIQAALDTGVRRVVALSTDKAANPVNLYGATKLCSDKLFVAANALAGSDGPRFAVVRYGNVLGSCGSVVPLFQRQRDEEGRLTLTDPDMTRFIITLEQGVDLVLTALQMMEGGEIFIPRIPSTTVGEIAEAVAPGCPRRIIGIRPGEKMHECMVPEDDGRMTVGFERMYIIRPAIRSWSSEEPGWLRQGVPCPAGFSYTSDRNDEWLGVDGLRELIAGLSPLASGFRPERPASWKAA